MKTFRILLCAVCLVVLVIGCKKPKERTYRWQSVDGGLPPDREECTVQIVDCSDKCRKRGASITCIGCCRDQDALCLMQQKYSFEYCDTAP
jgi:hypothetical protein